MDLQCDLCGRVVGSFNCFFFVEEVDHLIVD
jgi:hypothetical protein